VLEIDLKCGSCGAPLAATGAHKMIGQVMLGQYELIDVLGQGGMSVVFKGKHKLTDQEVALKILPPELAAHSQVKSRFLDEAKALAALDHANIVHLYNFGQEDGFFVLAMQLVQGQTWERMILERERLDWRLSCKIACDVLRALEYAHGRGVVHRDMKPSNVLVRKEDGAATVMDFGIAKMTTSTRLTATGQTMGTVRYMSPEQVRGHEVDHKTDIYSLGATLYESLTGETPFDGSTHFEIMTKHLSDAPRRPSALGVEVPILVEDALMRCLAKKVGARFENARELRHVLEQALRETDLGLVDTQKVSTEAIADIRAAQKAHQAKERDQKQQSEITLPPSRPATARDLADQLEGTTGMPSLTRSRWRWIALVLVVLASCAVAALLILRDDRKPANKSDPFAGLTLDAPTTVDRLTVITDGKVDANQVGKAYLAEVARVQKLVDQGLASRKHRATKLTDSVHEIYAVPQEALCTKNAYPFDRVIPANCKSAPAAVTTGWRDGAVEPRILVVSSKVEEGMRTAVPEMVCTFLPDTSPRSKLICDLARGAEPIEPQ